MLIKRSTRKNKKYMLYDNIQKKWIHFGDKRYEQFRDSTPLKLYRYLDHGDNSRRRRYFLRHSGVANKKKAIEKEMKKSRGRLNARILSHWLLW